MIENSSALEIYKEQIKTWINLEVQSRIGLITHDYFQDKFIEKVNEKFCLQMMEDNLAGDALIELISDPIYMKIYNQKNDYDRFSEILLEILQILYVKRYIGKSKYEQVKKHEKNTQSIEQRLMNFLQIQNFPSHSKKEVIRIWNEIILIDFNYFWSFIVFSRKILHLKSVKKLFKLFRHIIHDSEELGEEVYQKIYKQCFQVQEPSSSRQLRKLASQNYFIQGQDMEERIRMFLRKIQRSLQEKLDKKGIRNIKLQTYGSFRSKFCLLNSDIDLNISCRKQGYASQREMNTQILWQIYHFLKDKEEQWKITAVKPLINEKIKVPVVKIQLQNEYVKSLDFVVNNPQGVKNSKFLKKFARVKDIRNLGILLKMWGKKHALIDPFKLSSYGLLLMLIFFLMKTKKIDFVKDIEEEFEVKLHIKNVFYQEVLAQFFQFYSNDSMFYENREMICLVENCEFQHEDIFRDQYLINIHDVFNEINPNPGRLKKFHKNEFFAETRGAKHILKQANIPFKNIKQLFV